jgi:hypothetical protein
MPRLKEQYRPFEPAAVLSSPVEFEMFGHEQDDRFKHRFEEVYEAGEFGAVFTDELGATRSYASLIPTAAKVQQEFTRDLAGYSERAADRQALADCIAGTQLRSGWYPPWAENYPLRLRTARRSGCLGIELATGRRIVYWDNKAGLSRLCPDDAREDAMRLIRRYLPELVKLQASGHRLTYAVFTTPNAPPGKLREAMAAIFRRFKHVSKKFPQLKGALCVLEAPLGRERDWNVHLNVLLVTTQEFFDWRELRKAWHWNVELKLLPQDDEEAIRKALAEIIKYAIKATPSKSAEKAAETTCYENKHNIDVAGIPLEAAAQLECTAPSQAPHRSDCCLHPGAAQGLGGGGCSELHGATDRCPRREDRAVGAPARLGPAPAFTEWTDPERIEWLEGMHGFRRTRSYGVLYAVKKPELQPLGRIAWIGIVSLLEGSRPTYVTRLPLLDSIPEDKSHTSDPLKRWQIFCERVLPHEPSGFEGIEHRIPRLAELG